MNSFTHNGYTQVERRFGVSSIEPNYDIEEIEEAINFTNATGLLCCMEISLFLHSDWGVVKNHVARNRDFTMKNLVSIHILRTIILLGADFKMHS